ncbi:CoA-binding protein [Salipiger pallidus]|nr:CoA-binding protein [Salipiger pallidus]
MTRDFSRLLGPRSVALVGPEAWCHDIISNIRSMGYVWDIWPVVPGAGHVAGLRAFDDIGHLPAGPDAAIIGLAQGAAVEAVAGLSAKGAGGAICQGKADAEALAAAAGEMPLLGPDCRGMINALERLPLWNGAHGLRPVKRGVAIISRSASLAQTLSMHRRGLPIACIAVAHPGPAQTRMAMLGRALLEDPRVTALGIQGEDLGSPEMFLEMAQVAERLGKSIVVLRAGEEDGAAALLARAGAARVRTPEGLLEALKMLHVMGVMPAPQISALSVSGCAAGLIRELGQSRGLSFPAFTDLQLEALRSDLGRDAVLANPLDAQQAAALPVARIARLIAEAMSGRAVLTLLVIDHPRADRCDSDIWAKVIEAAILAKQTVEMPLAVVSALPEGMPEPQAEALLAHQLIPLAGLSAAFEALRACVKLGGIQRHASPLFVPPADTPAVPMDEGQVRAMLAGQGLDPLPATASAGPELRMRLSLDRTYGYVLTLSHGPERSIALLPLRGGEAEVMLRSLGLGKEQVASVVPALHSVQDHVIAEGGKPGEFELVLRPDAGRGAHASGPRNRAAGE